MDNLSHPEGFSNREGHLQHSKKCESQVNWDKWTTGNPTERLALIPAGQEHILEQEDGKKRWVGRMSNWPNFVIRTSNCPEAGWFSAC